MVHHIPIQEIKERKCKRQTKEDYFTLQNSWKYYHLDFKKEILQLLTAEFLFLFYLNSSIIWTDCVVPENSQILPMEGHWTFWGGGQGLQSKTFKMYQA